MAKKINVELTDDINPDLTADETITFSFDGATYEIDLNHKNVDKFHKLMEPWVNAARKTTPRRLPLNAAKPTGSGRTKEELDAIRAWANTQGIAAPARGRMPKSIIEQYENRDTATPATKVTTAMTKAKAKAVDAPTFSEAGK